MQHLLMAAVGFLMAVPLFAADEKTPDGKGAPQLQGKWRITKGEENGKPIAGERIKDDFLVIKGNRMKMVSTDKRQAWDIVYTADSSKKPGRLTMRVVKGEGKGKTARGIYALTGDTLKIAYVVGAPDFPNDFRTKEANEGLHLMFVLQRDRPNTRD